MIVKIKNTEVLIDEEDFEIFNKTKWHLCNKKGTLYLIAFVQKENKRKTLYYSREVLNAPSDKLVDHINGNTLDNRKCNLRLVDKRANAQNMRSNRNTTSKYKGVCFCKHRNKWRANIFYKKQNHLGYFEYEKDAARAYNSAALRYFGEYARLNVIEGDSE
jgi:hypothetical protein